MKLRLRNYETKETLRIQIPSPCSFLQLQQTLSLALPAPHPSPSSLRFALNAKDLLLAPSPEASLQSLGVASGDLLYFSANPNAFSVSSAQYPLIEEPNQLSESCTNQATSVQDFPQFQDPYQVPESRTNQETLVQELPQFQEPLSNEPQVSQEEETEGTESMDIDAFPVEEKFSEPYFLRKVLKQELGDDRSNHKLMAMAVHSVLLESGFVGFDPVSKMQIDQFHLPDAWPTPVSVCYSLPELLRNDYKFGSNLTDYVVLKFQTLDHFVQVYGSLVNGGSGLHKLSLDEHRFAPTLDLVWAICDRNDTTNDGNGGFSKSYSENVVFEFWKIVKDGLALPLLIDLCYRTGLSLPACFMRLPTELKLRILELLPGADVARMECVCSEMRYLASNNDLWKQKLEEEFASLAGATGLENWKLLFHSCWEKRKKRKRIIYWGRPVRFPIRIDPNRFGAPPLMFGGNYDRVPGLGIAPAPRSGQLFPQFRVGQTLHCHLGERQNDP